MFSSVVCTAETTSSVVSSEGVYAVVARDTLEVAEELVAPAVLI